VGVLLCVSLPLQKVFSSPQLFLSAPHRMIRLIEGNTKCRHDQCMSLWVCQLSIESEESISGWECYCVCVPLEKVEIKAKVIHKGRTQTIITWSCV
jgi:hypothetical protein